MHIVAIGGLTGTVEEAIRPLAADLGTTAYELRLALNAGYPAVVTVSADEAVARASALAIQRHGHTPVFCNRNDIASSDQMSMIRQPRFCETALLADSATREEVPYADIDVLLRATHRAAHETTETIKERKLRPVMAIATGGLVLTKTTSRAVTSTSVNIENVLYVFRRGSLRPWLLRERHTQYNDLGSLLQPTSMANFMQVIHQLRSHAPAARYDERLMTSRPIRGLADGVEATDVYAHLLAKQLKGETAL